ncbi:MAG: hypothetical protein ACYC0V_07645 [Armatimonadota bacterium]
MKLFGYSEIPNATQYLHMGYISATIPTQPKVFSTGLITFAIGVAVAILAWQRSKIMLFLGIIASVTGILVMIYSLSPALKNRFEYEHPEAVTERDLVYVSHQISEHMKAGEVIPTNIHIMQKKWHLNENGIKDAWFRDLRIEKNDKGGYTIISSAKDGVFDTIDDIKTETRDLNER